MVKTIGIWWVKAFFRCKPWVSAENDVKSTECSNSIWAIRAYTIYYKTGNVKADPGDPLNVVRSWPDGRDQLTDGYHAQANPRDKSTLIWGMPYTCRGVEIVIDLGRREGFDKV